MKIEGVELEDFLKNLHFSEKSIAEDLFFWQNAVTTEGTWNAFCNFSRVLPRFSGVLEKSHYSASSAVVRIFFFSMANISLADLAAHAVHFGHRATRWNPKMKPFLAGIQNGIHVFDLRKTLDSFHALVKEVERLAKEGKTILFVSTKPQTKELFEEFQKETGYPIVVNKWVGGTLTNFDTIKGRLKEMKKMQEMFDTGEIEKYTKKERGSIGKDLEKLKIAFGGIADMYRMPDAVFIVDGKRDEIAIREANRLNIPVIGFTDSNVNPDLYSIPVPANDDAISSLIYLLSFVFEAARVRGGEKKSAPKKEESPSSSDNQ